MDDLQLNISIAKKSTKKGGATQNNASEYKFMSKPAFTGKTIARKRPMPDKKSGSDRQIKVPKQSEPQTQKAVNLTGSLRDLSENKGKFQGQNYQDLSDDIQLRQKPRAGGWISSLFKNNPNIPRIGQRAVKPLMEKVFTEKTFSDLDIHPHSVTNLQQNLGLKELMVVQQSAIPVLLQGRDALIRSQTGSGKTLAYALPIVEGLQAIRPKINRHDGIRVVVVVPTRELAVQTYELFVKLIKPFTWIVPGLLSGGQKRKAEKARIRKGLVILVGTPGRINDHLRHTHTLNFAKTGCLILDEADRLLDMGYEKDVSAIVKAIEDHKKNATYDPIAMVKNQVKSTFPDAEDEAKEKSDNVEVNSEVKHNLTEVFLSKERQTILLSATLTKAVENLAGITLVDPVFVDASEGKALVADSLKSKDETKPVKPSSKEIKIKTPSKEDVQMKPKEQNMDQNNEQDEDIQESKLGLKLFREDKTKQLFAIDDSSDSEVDATPVPFPESRDKNHSKSKEVPTNTELGVVDMESDDEYVMPYETDITPSYESAVQTAVKADELVMPVSVSQSFLVVPMKLRLVTLCSLIVEHCVMNKKGGKLMVFMATLEMVDYHAELIETVLTGKKVKAKQKDGKSSTKSKKKEAEDEEGSDSSGTEFEVDYQAPPEGGLMPVAMDVFRLHGSMPHEQRIKVFDQFRKAKKGVLFCTDVAARGLDVPRVDMVLQYCAPASVTDYVHRVGRTGRASNIGEAVLFLLPSETEFMRHLEQQRIRLVQRNEKQSLDPLLSIVPGAASANRAAVAVQARLEQTVHTDRSWLRRASRAYTSWVRFYAVYPHAVRQFLDARQVHLGHAAKAFALRDAPAAIARRARADAALRKERPANKLTVHADEEKKRPGFPKAKFGAKGLVANKQSSMHTASEFDSGLPALDRARNKHNKQK